MGYTHYYRPQRNFTDQEWHEITEGTRRIIDKARKRGIEICGWDGEGRPEVGEDRIALNGTGKDDLSHESFIINKNMKDDFQFCKTARKPYDGVVVSILTYISDRAEGALKLSSDGGDEVFDNPEFPITAIDVARQRMEVGGRALD